MTDALRQEIAALRASPAAYLPIARRIEEGAITGLKPWRVGIVASFTAEPCRPFMIVETAGFGLHCVPWFGPYNQIEQEIFDPQSGLYRHAPDVIVVALRLEEIAPELVSAIVDVERFERAAADVRARLASLVSGVRLHSAARILLWNFAPTRARPAGLGDYALPLPQAVMVERLNRMVAEVAASVPDAYVFDVHRLSGECGLNAWFDPKLWFLGRIPFSVEAQRQIGRRLARTFNAIARPPRKCLVLDLDNTLWGGVVGEDGLGGIALGEDYPGNVYKAFQHYLLTLRERGVLLAIASKNNPDEAREVFERHPDSVLKLEHFSSAQIGWGQKPESLEAIARELNIHTDALAFFDDNPAERDLVRRALPGVAVIDAPASAMGYADAIEASGVFDVLVISDEDLRRAALYTQDKTRESLQHVAASVPEFLQALEMRAVCGPVDGDTLPRVAQLLAKTNQFNTTTRRYSAAELQRIASSGGIVRWLRLTDRFGDNGLVGVAIAIAHAGHQWRVDSLLLSCRVIGRGAEYVLLRELGRLVRERGGTELVGEYLPTPRNSPAKDVFYNAGFEALDDEGRQWRWDLRAGLVPAPEYIELQTQESASA